MKTESPLTPEETRKRFAKIVKAEGGPTAVALRLACSPNMVERMSVEPAAKSARDPGMKLARAIQELWGIPMEGWVPPPLTEMVKKIASSG